MEDEATRGPAAESDGSDGSTISDLMRAGRIPVPPIGALLGFQWIVTEAGEPGVEMEASERHANPMGTLHGGVLCDLADLAMGAAYTRTLGPGESFTTLELKINLFKPVWRARLRAVGRVVKRGRSVGMVECDITDEGGSLVARASSTCMTLRGEQARDR